MTSRSRKKHRITVPTSIRTTRTKTLRTALALVVATAPWANPVTALDGGQRLQPVPPMRAVPQAQPKSAATTSDQAFALRWRVSREVQTEANDSATELPIPETANANAVQPVGFDQANVAAGASATAQTSTKQMSPVSMQEPSSHEPSPVNRLRPVSQIPVPTTTIGHRSQLRLVGGAVQQATYTQDAETLPPRVSAKADDPWQDPFGDRQEFARTQAGAVLPPAGESDADAGGSAGATEGGLTVPALPTEYDESGFSIPSAQPPPLDAGRGGETPGLSNPDSGSPALPDTDPLVPFQGESPRAEREEDSPSDLEPSRPAVESQDLAPRGVGQLEPAPQAPTMQAPNRPAFGAGGDPTDAPGGLFGEDQPYETESCEVRVNRLLDNEIRRVSLDISPPFRPDLVNQDDFRRERTKFLDNQITRDWRDMRGRKVAEGRFLDLAYEAVVIETPTGEKRQLPLSELSQADLSYVTGSWGLPNECRLPDTKFQPREWLPIQMTWKASNACHKPLYFEDVNLERYGHTAGPIAQPIVSTAHFFVNIAVLPYKMGIHPPNECQYALGYYRPGNCAPWIIPPVPISLRGALFEAGAIGAGIGLIP